MNFLNLVFQGDNLITECHYSTVDRIRMTWVRKILLDQNKHTEDEVTILGDQNLFHKILLNCVSFLATLCALNYVLSFISNVLSHKEYYDHSVISCILHSYV